MLIPPRYVVLLIRAQETTQIDHTFTRNLKRGIDAGMEPAEQTVQDTVTRLLVDWKSGSKEAIDSLTPIVYNELRRLADYYLRDEHAAATLQPTALVHEAYMRLVAQSLPDWESRSHFFGVAAHLMRQILVDHARRRISAKRGSGAQKISIEESVSFAAEAHREIQ